MPTSAQRPVVEPVILAEITIRTDLVRPQEDLDIICAALAGAYGPEMRAIAKTGVELAAAWLRYAEPTVRKP